MVPEVDCKQTEISKLLPLSTLPIVRLAVAAMVAWAKLELVLLLREDKETVTKVKRITKVEIVIEKILGVRIFFNLEELLAVFAVFWDIDLL